MSHRFDNVTQAPSPARAGSARRRSADKGTLPFRPSCGRSKPVLMVCSPVYGQERLLDRIDRQLTAWGYEVTMSHRGQMRVDPGLSATDNCLRAVEEADGVVFLFTTHYGSSGKVGKSITHKELDHAIALGKLCWGLAHHDLLFARRLLKTLEDATGPALAGERGAEEGRWKEEHLLLLETLKLVDDSRVIAMYDTACRQHVTPYENRVGNWVQAYRTGADAIRFLSAQFAPRHTA